MPPRKDGRREPPPSSSALSTISSAANGTFSFAREAVMASVAPEHRRQESIRILSDLAPALMQPKFTTHRTPPSLARQPPRAPSRSLLRFPGRPSKPPPTATSLAILENAEGLAGLSLDSTTEGGWTQPKPGEERVSLIRGFRATIPSSELSKQRRRMLRGEIIDGEIGATDGKLGLKKLGDRARGLLTQGDSADEGELAIGRKSRRRKKKRDARRNSSGHLESKLHLEDLLQQADEIAQDKENLRIRQSLLNAEIYEVSQKMAALEEIRRRLDTSLLKLQEEGLELDDELEGVQELMASPMVTSAAGTKALPSSVVTPVKSSRRRKGPAFLPSEHDELPSGVAFLTTQGHTAPVTALDFDEPYGMLVTAGQDSVVKVWDLCDGEQVGELRGHKGMVKTVQVEDTLCLTGGVDGTINLWDLRLVEDYEERLAQDARRALLDRIEEDEQADDVADDAGPCVRTLEGHSKSITAMYYEDSTLVTGSADKTIRQWDVTTGQCVQTMDILWAMSNPPAAPVSPQRPRTLRHRSSTSFGSVQYDDLLPPLGSPGGSQQSILATSPPKSNFLMTNFSVPTPPFSDGTWDMYSDFVGGVQFWGFALASGSGDGAVRLWDMRTGQAHRTLNGHTAPVTCVQFDEHYIVSGSLDKTIRIWDFRMGDVAELHRYEYPVTAVQFDSRKVVACVGENGVEVYNRTTLEHKRLVVNGHTKPAERLRFIDKYLVSGGRDGCAKVWAM